MVEALYLMNRVCLALNFVCWFWQQYLSSVVYLMENIKPRFCQCRNSNPALHFSREIFFWLFRITLLYICYSDVFVLKVSFFNYLKCVLDLSYLSYLYPMLVLNFLYSCKFCLFLIRQHVPCCKTYAIQFCIGNCFS